MTLSERKDLLGQPCWNYKQVMTYCGVKKSKAFEIIKICKEQLNGKVIFDKSKVKRDSVIAYMGSSIEHERYVLESIQEGENS